MSSEQLISAAVAALSEKKAVDIRLLKIEKLSDIADYFIICNGTSVTHIKTLADEVEFKLEKNNVFVNHREGYSSGNWILLDYGSVIIHVFHPSSREFYNLEKLWADATEIDIGTVLNN